MANTRTLNQLIKIIENASISHKQIKDFGVGDDWEIGADKALVHSVLYINPIEAFLVKGATSNSYNALELTINFRVFDLVNKDESNENEVLSDSLDILTDFVTYLSNFPEYRESNISIISDLLFEPFTEETDEEISGWEGDIVFRLIHSKKYCDLPIE